MTDSLGAQLLAEPTVEEWLHVEETATADQRFSAVDALVAAVTAATFAGKTPLTITGTDKATTVTFDHVPAEARKTMPEMFTLGAQQAAGAWWLPESVVLKPGAVNVPAYYRSDPRWAMNAAATAAGRVRFEGNPDALACWSLLVPFFDALCAPLVLRGPSSGTLEPEARTAAWAGVDGAYANLGLSSSTVTAALSVMRPGNGWSRLSGEQKIAAKVTLVEALGAEVGVITVRRWRALMVRPLVERYYAKAKKTNPTARAVLVKAVQPVLAGYFGGAWLGLLNYLGEQPAAGEEITTALPAPRLYVQGSAKVQRVAAERDLPVTEVAQILASYLGSDEISSPVERRLEVLREYWLIFDITHAGQLPGSRSLMGLVPDRWLEQGNHVPFATPVYEQVLPARLLSNIDALWGGFCVPRYPDRIVSALYPHAEMAAAFGRALRFWHDVAVTAWFICQGPYARTDLAGMVEHYARDVEALKAAGTPVTPALFADLKAAEGRLGPEQELWRDGHVHHGNGFTIETAFGAGTRRDGFEILRDIITAHRRAWAAEHLEETLRRGWEDPLREIARQVNRAIAGRGKPPTPKQFATLGGTITNAWFGGDLSALYAAVGEKPPGDQQRVQLLPHDRVRFCNSVFDALGGKFASKMDLYDDPTPRNESWAVERLAQDALRFVQLEELLDRHPTEKEFGVDRITWPAGVSYERFAGEVTRIRRELPTAPAEAGPEDRTPQPTEVRIAVTETTPPKPRGAGGASPTSSTRAAQAGRPGLLGRLFGRRSRET